MSPVLQFVKNAGRDLVFLFSGVNYFYYKNNLIEIKTILKYVKEKTEVPWDFWSLCNAEKDVS